MDRLVITPEHVRKLRRLGVNSLQEARDTIEEAKTALKSGKMDEFLSTKAGLCQRAVVNAFAYGHMNRKVREEMEQNVSPQSANNIVG